MARIPNEEIERLKKEIPMERLVTGFGVELKRQGKDLFGRCPFHDDKTPSLSVSPETNLWHCLGACNSGGDVIAWVMKTRGVSFRHAVELLKNDHPSLAAGDGRVVRKGTTVKLASPVAADADDQQTLRDVVSFYHQTLKESPEALRYLESRGLNHPELVEHFQIGFANRKLGLTLPDKNRKAGEEMRSRLQRLGILRESGHEHFNGSVVFPIFDLAGNVLGMYGRKITPNLREGTPLHLYLPGPHKGVWNEHALQASKEIILCESIIDALTFWCAGFRNVTASYGVNGFTDDHKAAFAKHGVKHVWIAYDRDEAGDAAAEQLKKELSIGTARVLFPKGMDANEYALKVTPASQSFAVLLNRTEKPPAVPAEPVPQISGDEITLHEEDRRYRIRGLAKNMSHELLKVNVLVHCGDLFHVDTLDLYSARQRAAFTKQASEELRIKEETLRRDLGRVLLQLEKLQDEQIRKALTPEKPEAQMSDEDRAAALALLRDPKLLDRILEHFTDCGMVGEETNKLVGYLAAVSRHLEAPLAVVVQSSSAAGKSSLMDAVLQFVPEEERIQYSAMTGQALYYMGEMDLKHKVLAIVEEEGASRAAYALKLLQSEGSLTIASTGKDPATGKLVTHQYRVEGPVMMFLTTTAIELDEELMNRCLVLAVNEDREQTQAIHQLQRERQTLEGLLRKQKRQDLIRLHQNAQRLLKPLFVVNPYALELTFPDERTRMRRDHSKYLTLIGAIALLHQYQRPVRTAQGVSYVEATREDIAMADRLMKELLARSLDELPPQTRKLLPLLAQLVNGRADFRFSRKEVREFTRWGHTQLKLHLRRLEELEYLIVHRGGRGQSFVYELNWSGLEDEKSGGGRPQVGGMSGGWSGQRKAREYRGKRHLCAEWRKRHIYGGPMKNHVVAVNQRDESPLAALLEKHLEDLRVRNYSEYTVKNRRVHIGLFLDWCRERGIREPVEVTRTVLESYQRHVFYYRKKSGEPLAFTGQHSRLTPLRVWFRWLARQRYILHNPASELELPRIGMRLPKAVLSASEAELVLAETNIHDALGLRDRAILEMLYSTGMRRLEMVRLKRWDLDLERVTVTIRQGKRQKDRILPLGDRAAAWVRKYLDEARPQLVCEPDDQTVFVSQAGEPLSLDYLTQVVRGYVEAALSVDGKPGKQGACHLFRHTMATLMLEGGADIRYIQAMLGHADLKTTEIYTHVAIRQLQQIHRATHPAKLEREKKELLDALEAEAGDDDEKE